MLVKGELTTENDRCSCRTGSNDFTLFKWWCFPALAYTGAARKYIFLLFSFIVMPFIPPRFFIFLFSCSLQWSRPPAVPGMFDFWQLNNNSWMLAILSYSPHLHFLSNDACLLDTLPTGLYLIRSKLEISLIIASKDERYKSQSREQNCFDESE